MAKLYFNYATMNAGKSAYLLQANHNYVSGGQKTMLFKPEVDTRSGPCEIRSRIGVSTPATSFTPESDLYHEISAEVSLVNVACVFVDEAQFLTSEQVSQLARVVDHLHVPVMCFGLRSDFKGRGFPGSIALMIWAEEIKEIRSVCHCSRRATMVVRIGADGKVAKDGDQVVIDGEGVTYKSLCRAHWREATGL